MNTPRTWTTAECRPSDLLMIMVFIRDDRTCVYCGTNCGDKATIDHVMPASWFSRRTPKSTVNHPTNLATACKRCNSKLKGGLSLSAYAEKLLSLGTKSAVVTAMVERVNAARLKAIKNL